MRLSNIGRAEGIAKQKDLRAKITGLSREQNSIPLTLENVDRKQEIQDEIKRLEAEFKSIIVTTI